MGGEITYTYISGNIYQFNATIYRDCNECTIGNQGGGSSTSNCTGLDELYVRTVSSACGNNRLSPISLTKTGFTNITPVCDFKNSVCGSNPTIDYGIEAHHYTGTIDFSKYTTYTNCMFEVFIHIPERNEHINILTQEAQKLYISAKINPWIENKSSPQFTNDPKILFPVNEAVYGGDYVTKTDGDSIVYKWVQPYKNYNSPIPYSSGYSSQHFIDAHCPTGTICTPDNTATPPQGIYLNSSTGDYAFTPISSDQHGTRVIEVEQWRLNSGAYYLAGTIKRDVIVIVNNSSNHSPKIIANDIYEICVGETFNQVISTTDFAYLSGTLDSVQLETTNSLVGLSSSTSSTSIAPYQQLTLNLEADSSHIGTHYIRIKARDNHCPLYAESYKTIQLIVHPSPTATFTITDEFCGNNKIDVLTTASLDYTLNINNTESLENLPYLYTNFNKEEVKYKITYVDNYGCSDSFEQIISNIGNTEVEQAQIAGETNVCEGIALTNWLMHSEHSVENINWKINTQNLTGDTLKGYAISEKVNYSYSLISEDKHCRLADSFMLSITKSPKIELNSMPSLCYQYEYDLSKISISPSGGQWTYESTAIPTNFELGKYIPNLDIEAQLAYIVSDDNTGCSSTKEVTIKVMQAPELVLQNQQICAGKNPFNLNNIIQRPFRFSTANIEWKMLSKLGAYYDDGISPKLDVPTYGPGIYLLTGENSLPNGCKIKDTASLLVKDELKLEYNGTSSICQSNQDINLNQYFDINIQGGNWSSDRPDIVYYDTLRTTNYCGVANLDYIYDRNGCYDALSVPINIVCKPSFTISIEDSICMDAAQVDLPSLFQWQGLPVTSNKLDPSLLVLGPNVLNASITTKGCTYDTAVILTALSPIDINLASLPNKLCEDEQLKIQVNVPTYATITLENCDGLAQRIGSTYLYTPSPCDLKNNSIDLTLTSASRLACPAHTKSLSLAYLNKPKVSFQPNTNACEPYNLDLKLTDEKIKHLKYSLSKNEKTWNGSGAIIKAQRLTEGIYKLNLDLEHINGCFAGQEIANFITVHPRPEAALALLGENKVTLSKRELMLSSYSTINTGSLVNKWYYTKQGATTLFSTQDNPILELPLDTGVFMLSLVAESNKNCKDTASTIVTVVPDIIAFIPSAFTPDNKGPKSNSVFRVTSDHAAQFHIEIFNKWGQKVFQTDNIENAWDGTYLGQYCQNGVYIYAIELVNKTGELYKYQGTVNLLR
jgi:gliding motility-associated-like protein